MLQGFDIYAGVALAGLLSFLSPCVLPLVPPYLGLLGGTTVSEAVVDDGIDHHVWRRIVLGSIVFVLGFSTVFIALGAGASLLGQLILTWKRELTIAAGLTVILFGLHFLGILKVNMLYRHARYRPELERIGYAGAYLMGLAFAFGWTPCIGPILATVLSVAANEATLGAGVALLAAYSLGLGVPFILAAVAVGPFLGFTSAFRRHLGLVEKVSGAILVIAGVMMLTGSLNVFGQWLLDTFPALADIEAWFAPASLQERILERAGSSRPGL